MVMAIDGHGARVSIRGVRRTFLNDVVKILCYLVAVLLLGAIIAPCLYRGGKALAEATNGKQANAFVDWLAAACRRSEFERFFGRAVQISALLLFYPLMRWLKMGRGPMRYRDTPWSLRLPDAAIAANEGQPLQRNPLGPAQLLIGFLLASVTLLLLGYGLLRAGAFIWQDTPLMPHGGANPLIRPLNVGKAVKEALTPMIMASVIEEIVFRGILLGIFLRAMRPSRAIIALSVLFAALHFLEPSPGVKVLEPESMTAGLWLLGHIIGRFAEPMTLIAGLCTLTGVGLVLAYARWRTASLWMPIGLHAGWVFGIFVFKALTWPVAKLDPTFRFFIGYTLKEGLAPLIVVGLTGVAVHFLTRRQALKV